MRYSIGYQLPDALDSTLEICKDYRDHINDVFFSFGTEPSGRSPLGTAGEKETIEALQLEELAQIKALGIGLTLLLNANCYGSEATSQNLKDRTIALVDKLQQAVGIDSVTTASPFVADVLKNAYHDLQITASVNMRVGSITAMKQLSGSFDGFYVKKEVNRDFAKLKQMHAWCEANGKKLHMLANSGCLTDCAFQTFHDNLIAHQRPEEDPGVSMGYPAPCHRYLAGLPVQEGLAEFMRGNWVRPEEIALYEPYFDVVKLATRMHARPRMVVAAYCRGRFKGNLLDLTEPSYSHLFRGYVVDNTRIPKPWFSMASGCGKRCEDCHVCENAIRQATVRYHE